MNLETIDLVIVFGYAIALIAIATMVSREKAGHQKDSTDFFLAGKALPWWAVGASLIAANISAEQIIGMSGSGYVVGLAIASYEWMAAATLLIVGKYFLPVFLKHGIYTMPQFLEHRFDKRVKTVMSIFWLALYTFVNLTAILWLGSTAINSLTGFDITHGLIALALFAVAYSIYGGLKAVALTDIIQVALLVAGGLLIAWISLDKVGGGLGPMAGFGVLIEQAPGKFDMILSPDNPQYMNLPGIGVLIGGMWMMNLSYWGFNQYIIQRALGAKSTEEAQRGIVFAAFLKLLMPLIIVIPGIAAFVLAQDASNGMDISRPDQAYPNAMLLAPAGIRGLIFAALIAAIVSSLGSMMNSISTIFTLDIYKPMHKGASEKTLVRTGRTVSLIAITIAVAMAQPLLGNFPQAFQYIQEFTGFFTPGICAIFILGVFWKSSTANGALLAALGSFFFSLAGKLYFPMFPFMDRVLYVFFACIAVIFLMAMIEKKDQGEKAIDLKSVSFSTSSMYNLGGLIVVIILALLYYSFW